MSGERGTALNKSAFFSRLSLRLMLTATFAFLVGSLLYAFFSMEAYRYLDARTSSQELYRTLADGCADRLQDYVSAGSISLSDTGALDAWAFSEENMVITLYQENEVIYQNVDLIIGDNFQPAFSYSISFQDGTALALILCVPSGGSYLAADLACGFLAIMTALLILYAFIRRKIRYIALLESELQILKGGNLDHPITVIGKDELASLATEMDHMRQAIRDRQAREEQAVKANRDLVTAMSHDLRTPLTSLLGYTDILLLGKNDGQQDQYIRAIRDKARRIKELSDQLFEYFLVYGKEREDLNFQPVNAVEFLGQVVEESLFDLESEGFSVERESDEIRCSLFTDIPSVRRVFGNIFSNLSKYADRSHPVQVRYRQTEDTLLIQFRNRAAGPAANAESSGIGLKTCERIMTAHSGIFRYRLTEEYFEIEVGFPIRGDE